MDERRHKILLRTAVGLTLAWIAWTVYDTTPHDSNPDARQLSAASRQLEDGHYHEAHTLYREIFEHNPQSLAAMRGMALALTQLGLESERQRLDDQAHQPQAGGTDSQYARALAWYDRVILVAENDRAAAEADTRTLGVTYANRGILRDHMGDHRGALQDYTASLRLAPEVAEGPGWLTRFLRNQPERPPDVAQRAAYLRRQLQKPEAERLLRLPEADFRQRAYTMD